MFHSPAVSLRFQSKQQQKSEERGDAQTKFLYPTIDSTINKLKLFVINKCRVSNSIARNNVSKIQMNNQSILQELDLLYKPDVLVRSIKKQQECKIFQLQALDLSCEEQSPYCRTILQNLELFSTTLKCLYSEFIRAIQQDSFQLFPTPNRIGNDHWEVHDEKQKPDQQEVSEKIKKLVGEMQGILLKDEEEQVLDSLFSYNIFGLQDSNQQNRVKEWVSYGQLNEYTETKKKDGVKWVSKKTILGKHNDFVKDDEKQTKYKQYGNLEKIVIDKEFSTRVFSWVFPQLHQYFLSSISSAFHQISPFFIKSISFPPNTHEQPRFQTKNYFREGVDQQRAILYYCKPSTKSIFYYNLYQIADRLSISKQCLYEYQLKISWSFGIYVRTTITPEGSIFAINCRTTSQKLDPSLYQINDFRVKNRGPIPCPLKSSSLIYCDRFIYVIGGAQENNLCSRKAHKYSIKQRKWIQLSDSNIGTRNPTLCIFRERYILKIGGLNQFNYINKVVQIFDTLNNQWAIVNLNAKSLMDEINILQNCCAVQINNNQIYVFGGRNMNNYSADTGLIIEIISIKEKIKAPPRAEGQIWSTNQAKKSIISFFGIFSSSNIITYMNSLCLLRTKCCRNL